LYWSLITFITPLVIATLPIMKIQISERVLHLMLGFSAGILGGVTFADILPEAFALAEVASLPSIYVSSGVGMGFLILLLVERYLLTAEEIHGGRFHIHERPVLDHKHGIVGVGSLAFHGLIDGFIIPISFAAGTSVGTVVTFAVVLHQIPDSFAGLSLALVSSENKKRAFLYVVITAIDTPVGIFIGLLLIGVGGLIIPFGLGLSAGTFVYVSASDLVPELQHKSRSLLVVLSMVLGFALIMGLSWFLPEA
jgi:zinc transporter ZupT